MADVSDRGVSTALGYALSLAVTVLLVVGLLTAAGGFASDERERVIRSEAEVVSQRAASSVMTTDRLAAAADGGTVRVSSTLPETLAGEPYEIRLLADGAGGDPSVVVSTQDPDVTASAPVVNDSQVRAATVRGGPLTVRYENGTLTLGALNVTAPPSPSLALGDAVVFAQGDALKTTNRSAGVRDYVIDDATAIGPPQADLDGDGDLDVPVGRSTGDLVVVDASNDTTTLTSDAEVSGTGLQYAAGTWDGSDTSVYYPGTGNDIRRVDAGGTTATVYDPGNGVSGVVGFGDLTGDGNEELVYIGGSQQLRLLTTGGSMTKSITANGAGTPADFDGDGVARVPVVDGSNNLKLADDTQSGTTLVSGGVAKSPVATVDWDDDGAMEVVFIDAASGTLRYLDDVTGSNTVKDVGGGSLAADADSGVA